MRVARKRSVNAVEQDLAGLLEKYRLQSKQSGLRTDPKDRGSEQPSHVHRPTPHRSSKLRRSAISKPDLKADRLRRQSAAQRLDRSPLHHTCPLPETEPEGQNAKLSSESAKARQSTASPIAAAEAQPPVSDADRRPATPVQPLGQPPELLDGVRGPKEAEPAEIKPGCPAAAAAVDQAKRHPLAPQPLQNLLNSPGGSQDESKASGAMREIGNLVKEQGIMNSESFGEYMDNRTKQQKEQKPMKPNATHSVSKGKTESMGKSKTQSMGSRHKVPAEFRSDAESPIQQSVGPCEGEQRSGQTTEAHVKADAPSAQTASKAEGLLQQPGSGIAALETAEKAALQSNTQRADKQKKDSKSARKNSLALPPHAASENRKVQGTAVAGNSEGSAPTSVIVLSDNTSEADASDDLSQDHRGGEVEQVVSPRAETVPDATEDKQRSSNADDDSVEATAAQHLQEQELPTPKESLPGVEGHQRSSSATRSVAVSRNARLNPLIRPEVYLKATQSKSLAGAEDISHSLEDRKSGDAKDSVNEAGTLDREDGPPVSDAQVSQEEDDVEVQIDGADTGSDNAVLVAAVGREEAFQAPPSRDPRLKMLRRENTLSPEKIQEHPQQDSHSDELSAEQQKSPQEQQFFTLHVPDSSPVQEKGLWQQQPCEPSSRTGGKDQMAPGLESLAYLNSPKSSPWLSDVERAALLRVEVPIARAQLSGRSTDETENKAASLKPLEPKSGRKDRKNKTPKRLRPSNGSSPAAKAKKAKLNKSPTAKSKETAASEPPANEETVKENTVGEEAHQKSQDLETKHSPPTTAAENAPKTQEEDYFPTQKPTPNKRSRPTKGLTPKIIKPMFDPSKKFFLAHEARDLHAKGVRLAHDCICPSEAELAVIKAAAAEKVLKAAAAEKAKKSKSSQAQSPKQAPTGKKAGPPKAEDIQLKVAKAGNAKKQGGDKASVKDIDPGQQDKQPDQGKLQSKKETKLKNKIKRQSTPPRKGDNEANTLPSEDQKLDDKVKEKGSKPQPGKAEAKPQTEKDTQKQKSPERSSPSSDALPDGVTHVVNGIQIKGSKGAFPRCEECKRLRVARRYCGSASAVMTCKIRKLLGMEHKEQIGGETIPGKKFGPGDDHKAADEMASKGSKEDNAQDSMAPDKKREQAAMNGIRQTELKAGQSNSNASVLAKAANVNQDSGTKPDVKSPNAKRKHKESAEATQKAGKKAKIADPVSSAADAWLGATIEAEDEDPDSWSEDQKARLVSATMGNLDATAPNYWKQVAKMVPGKSAMQCYDFHFNSDLGPTPAKPKSSKASGKKKPSAATSKGGTAKTNLTKAGIKKMAREARWEERNTLTDDDDSFQDARAKQQQTDRYIDNLKKRQAEGKKKSKLGPKTAKEAERPKATARGNNLALLDEIRAMQKSQHFESDPEEEVDNYFSDASEET